MSRASLPWLLCLILASVVVVQASGLSLAPLGETPATAAVPAVQDPPREPKPVYEAADLVKQRADSERSYLPFVNIATMDLGIYSLPKGGTDSQSPHALDEIYYVLSGKAKIDIAGTSHAVKQGSIILVAAGAEHKFLEIEEDLDLLVFFSKAQPKTDK